MYQNKIRATRSILLCRKLHSLGESVVIQPLATQRSRLSRVSRIVNTTTTVYDSIVRSDMFTVTNKVQFHVHIVQYCISPAIVLYCFDLFVQPRSHFADSRFGCNAIDEIGAKKHASSTAHEKKRLSIFHDDDAPR